MKTPYDAIILGAGHNGLVTACYLARAGLRVLVLERRYLVGGACVTEEVFPGYKVSTASYVSSLFRKDIVADLDLGRHGYQVLERSPSSFTPFPNGTYLLLGPDPEQNRAEIGKFSSKDAAAYERYEAMLAGVGGVLEPLLDQVPPNVVSPGFFDLWQMLRLGLSMKEGLLAPGVDLGEVVEMLTSAARPVLDRWFESEELKVTLATDAVIGAMASPSMAGTGYMLFHHVMGETNGKKGVWGYVRGGMGGLTQALRKAAEDLGVEIRCNAEVSRIVVNNQRAVGVSLTSGETIGANVIASNVDAQTTFLRLLPKEVLPQSFVAAIGRISYESAALKINVALSELPNFRCLKGTAPGPQHRGTIHICPDQDYIERAYDDAKYGRPSAFPILECTIPSVVDPSVAPPGKHIMSIFVQYAPYKLKEGSWDAIKEDFADRCFAILDEYAPNFSRSVLHRQVLSPLDLERIFGLTGGHICQGAMTLHQLFCMRPAPGYASYATPLAGLYLCGSAAHPGGGVMGAAGRNAARVILRQFS